MVALLSKALAGLFVVSGVSTWIPMADLSPAEPAPSPATDGSAECVDADAESVAKGMLFKIHNQCSAPVSCTVTWELKCGAKDGPSVTKTQTIPIWSGSDGTVNASAASCASETWSIENPAWECKTSPTK